MDNSGIMSMEGILMRNLHSYTPSNSGISLNRLSHLGAIGDVNITTEVPDPNIRQLKAGTIQTLFKKIPGSNVPTLRPMIIHSSKMDKTYWANNYMWFTGDFKPVIWITGKAKVTVSPNIYRDVDDPLCKYIRDKVLIALYKSDYEVKIEEIPFTLYKHSKAIFNFNKVFYEHEEK